MAKSQRASKIGHERPHDGERRRHPRYYDRALYLDIRGLSYETRNWSLSGAWVDGTPDGIRVGDQIRGTLRLYRETLPGKFAAKIIRLQPDGSSALKFNMIEPKTLATLTSYRVC